jgi:hypothetical protein
MQANYPQPRRGFFRNAVVAVAIALAFAVGKGGISIEQFAPSAPASQSAPVAATTPPFRLPTVAPIQAASQAEPVVQHTVQVIPRGQYHAPPTTIPPTAVIPTVSAETQKIYDAIIAGPESLTPIPLAACESGAETYVTTPVRVLNQQGMPIGEVRGRSCVSDQEAHDNATKLAQEVMDKDKLAHPDAWK